MSQFRKALSDLANALQTAAPLHSEDLRPGIHFHDDVAAHGIRTRLGWDAAPGGGVVPATKRLVIEHVSGVAALENGQKLLYSRINTLAVGGGAAANHYLEATTQGSVPGTGDYFVISTPMRVYAVGTMQIGVFRTDTVGLGQVNVTISGYLDVP